MQVVCISDTHMRHERLTIPQCDLLIHAGDMTRRGQLLEAETFVRWMSEQPARHKVLVAGNHDKCCERQRDRFAALLEGTDLIYLEDSEVELEGLRIWGSPVTPTFRNMAFNRDPGPDIRKHWDAIPSGIDILVTHGPPRSILDRMILGRNVGCVELLERVRRVEPKLHVFGHIHEARGHASFPGLTTRFVNAANARLLPVGQRGPTIIDLPE